MVFITLPVIFYAIIGVIAERHNAVVKITFSFILLQFCLFFFIFLLQKYSFIGKSL